MVCGVPRSVLAIALVVAVSASVAAQRGPGGGAPPTAQAAAPIDLVGYWVSIVTEDWRWRMVTPKKGDYASIANLMTPEARKIADSWDPATDGSCLGYGAAAVMRMPTRLHITWENERTLKVETDSGQQTRRFVFDAAAIAPAERSLQGFSLAQWERAGAGRGGRGAGGPPPAGPAAPPAPGAATAGRGGSLKVVTTQLSGGWLRKNGVPYSDSAVLTEYFDRFPAPGGQEWFVVTSVVADPKYLTQEFVTSSHFRRERDGSGWEATPCKPAT